LGHDVKYKRDTTQWCTSAGCLTSDVAHPLELDFLNNGSPWSLVAVNDFNGNFEAKGVMTLKKPAPQKPKPRKKPTIESFGAPTTITYRPECAEELLEPTTGAQTSNMSTWYWDNLGEENPCKYVGGKWDGETKKGMAYLTYIASGNIAGFDGTIDMSESGKKEAGGTYKHLAACESRGAKNTLAATDRAQGEATRAMIMGLYYGQMDNFCGMIPAGEAVPLGFGLEMKPAAYCKWQMHIHRDMHNGPMTAIARSMGEYHSKIASKDCGRTAEFNRIFCDLHCIRDAVKKGNTAILTTVNNAASHLQGVMDELLEYYTGGLSDMQGYMVQNQQVMIDLLKTVPGVQSMFTEVKDLLGGKLDERGQATAMRSLEAFSNRLSKYGPEHFANATAFMNDISSETTNLLNTARLASSKQLTTAGAVARQTTSSLHSLNKLLQAENQMIGMYRTNAAGSKHRQQTLTVNPVVQLKEEIEKATFNQILMDFDRSWWTIRTKLDAYLDAADNQAATFGDAIQAIDSYTSKCSMNMKEMNGVQRRTIAVDDATYRQLHDTWYAVIEEVGILSARIADAGYFYDLARTDALTTDLEPNRAEICSGSAAGKEVAAKAVNKSLATGFAAQTWSQLESVVYELPMLEDRFFAHGHEVPGDKSWDEAVQKSWKAANAAFKAGDSLVAEAIDRLCGTTSEDPAKTVKRGLIELQEEVDHNTEKANKNDGIKNEIRLEIRILAVVAVVLTGVLLLDKVVPLFRQKTSPGGGAEPAEEVTTQS